MRKFFLILLTTSCLNSFGQDFLFYKHVVRNDYKSQYQLVDSVARFEQKFPNYNIEKQLKFDVQIIVVDSCPYRLTDSVKSIVKSRLNEAFKHSSIRFNFRKETFQLFSKFTVDYFYDNYDKQIDSCSYNKNFINLYLFNNIGSSFIGLSQYPITKYNRVMINVENINDGTLEHEFGHYFGLLHTFENTYFVYENDAKFEGDFIEDTPTDLYDISFGSNCETFGDYKDFLGNIFCPNMKNYMSYYGSCRTEFSERQIGRMNLMAKFRHEKAFLK